MGDDNIKVGNYIIVQRQKYTKLIKFNKLNAQIAMGKDQVQLKNIDGHPYSTTFKMVPNTMYGKKVVELEACSDVSSLKESISITESGMDNRHLVDDGETQSLKSNDIAKLRESGSSASEIVGQIIENSKTFNTKTEYSQDKYLRKKEKKYFEFLQIRRPSIRLLVEIMYRQEPEKVLGLRMDSLSQIISYSNICANGNYLLYESGTNGLVPAALLNAIGANTQGKLLYIHQGNVPQKQALLALNLGQEQMDRCISVNVYSLLRQYYQKSGGQKRKLDETNDDSVDNPPAKATKVDEMDSHNNKTETNTDVEGNTSGKNGTSTTDENVMEIDIENNDTKNGGEIEANDKPEGKTPKWFLDNERGCELLREQLDSLIVVAKEHPVSILRALLPFVKPSRPVVVFNLSRDILMETFIDLKTNGNVTGLKLTSNWLRMYQVLPNRTHPDVTMGGNSGFILHGYTVR